MFNSYRIDSISSSFSARRFSASCLNWVSSADNRKALPSSAFLPYQYWIDSYNDYSEKKLKNWKTEYAQLQPLCKQRWVHRVHSPTAWALTQARAISWCTRQACSWRRANRLNQNVGYKTNSDCVSYSIICLPANFLFSRVSWSFCSLVLSNSWVNLWISFCLFLKSLWPCSNNAVVSSNLVFKSILTFSKCSTRFCKSLAVLLA